MTKWPSASLDEICEAHTGTTDPRRQPNRPFSYVDISSVDNKQKRISKAKTLLGAEAPSRARRIIKENDIIVSMTRPNLNAVALVPEELGGQICSTGFAVLRANGKVIPEYLFHFTTSSRFVRIASGAVSGAMYPAITERFIRSIRIPLPPLAEQRRIVDVLNRADGIRRLRREAQEKVRQIIPALFVAMFGDPAAAAGAVHPLEDLAEVISGVTKGRRFNGVQPVLVPYLRVANVQAGYLDLSEIKTIEALPEDVERLALRRDDVLLTEGGDFDKLGRAALWEADIPNVIHQNHVFRVRTERMSLDPCYLVAYLQTTQAKQYFLHCAKRTTNLASINMTQLKQLPVPCPPLALQRAFAERVAAVKGITTQQERMAEASERLMASLMARVFDGERPA